MTKTKLGRDPFQAKSGKKGKKKAGGAAPKRAGWRELTHYWIPRIKACVYVRAVKLVSRFA